MRVVKPKWCNATMNTVKAYVFDAYGTLFDVHSVMDRCEQIFPGHGAQLTILWRAKQLEYTWLRTLMGRYEDFAQITRDALVFACRSLSWSPSPDQIDRLMHAYRTLRPFPDTAKALDTLAGTPCAILSNGSSEMLRHVIHSAGFECKFQLVLSVDAVKVFKPHPAAYQLAVSGLGLKANEIAFVSANGWDVAGAKAFGFQACWLNRSNASSKCWAFRRTELSKRHWNSRAGESAEAYAKEPQHTQLCLPWSSSSPVIACLAQLKRVPDPPHANGCRVFAWRNVALLARATRVEAIRFLPSVSTHGKRWQSFSGSNQTPCAGLSLLTYLSLTWVCQGGRTTP